MAESVKLEINSVGDWVDARVQWEKDNNPDPMTVDGGGMTRGFWLQAVLVSGGSFAGGTFLKNNARRIDAERAQAKPGQ